MLTEAIPMQNDNNAKVLTTTSTLLQTTTIPIATMPTLMPIATCKCVGYFEEAKFGSS
jgi:hypothetical protein